MRKPIRLLVLVVALVLLPFVDGGLAHAAFVVNSAADTVDANPGNGVCADASGACTLRAAIMEANALSGSDTITLPAGTYTLTIPGAGEEAAASGDLDITGTLTIVGAGAATTIVDGGGLDRVFEVRPGATAAISGLTIRNGSNGGTGHVGGGILNQGTLTLDRTTVSHNANFNIGGGGIYNAGALTLSRSTVSGNSAVSKAGGILNYFGGTVMLIESTVSGNSADLNQGTGGGIYNLATITLTNSTVSGNASVQGGGIAHFDGRLTLNNSTVHDNTAGNGLGGGVFLSTCGGHCEIQGAKNTIIAGNHGGDCNLGIGFSSGGHNLVGDGSCGFSGPGDLVGNPLLGPLANNGGPTETHALLGGSPAIDAVPAAACTDDASNPLATDQRGGARPQGGACDIGAYEVGAGPCVAAPSGMIGWWPFDEGAGATSFQDIVGGNHATPMNSPLGGVEAPQPVAGIVAGAVHFPKFPDGLSGARVSPQGALVAVGSGNFTIDAWVNVPQAPANIRHYIVNKFDGVNKGFGLYVVSPGVSANERLEFVWGDGTITSTVQTISPLTTGQWHHVAVTVTRNVGGSALDIRLYVDGVQQGQQTGNPPGLGSFATFLFLEIGMRPSNFEAPITLDELEIFNVALSAADVQAIYNAGSAGKCKCTTGGQSVDLTVVSAGVVSGVGNGTAATVSSPLTINYSTQGCFGHEMFLLAVVNAPPIVLPPSYYNGTAWVPVPTPLSLITPFLSGGPATANGTHTLFSGPLPTGTYDLYLVCDLFVNGHLDVPSPACLSGAFDRVPLTVQ